MSTAAQVLALARKELGYSESANNSNKFAKPAGHADNQPWCATFLVAMFRAAGMKLPSESAYTPAMANGFKKAGLWSANKPAVGAVVFFKWPSMGRIAHVGIVEAVRPDGSIVTIEGNTNKAGSRTGGSVLRMVRRANIAGYGLPRYGAGGAKPTTTTATTSASGTPKCPGTTRQGDKGPVTKAFQERLVARRLLDKADGDHGPKTTAALKKFQSSCGLTADGVGGPKTWDRLCAK